MVIFVNDHLTLKVSKLMKYGIRINSELKAFFFNFMRIYNGEKKYM